MLAWPLEMDERCHFLCWPLFSLVFSRQAIYFARFSGFSTLFAVYIVHKLLLIQQYLTAVPQFMSVGEGWITVSHQCVYVCINSVIRPKEAEIAMQFFICTHFNIF